MTEAEFKATYAELMERHLAAVEDEQEDAAPNELHWSADQLANLGSKLAVRCRVMKSRLPKGVHLIDLSTDQADRLGYLVVALNMTLAQLRVLDELFTDMHMSLSEPTNA